MFHDRDEFLLDKLEELERAICTDIERHDEHRTLEYAIQELRGLYRAVDGLEEELFNMDEEIIALEGELVTTDTIIDTLEDYYSWSIDSLKTKAKALGLTVTGTKAELVRRIFDENRRRGVIS